MRWYHPEARATERMTGIGRESPLTVAQPNPL
jgi:hypothetical protein